jgi:F420-non-reducing hydrogenase iron-sulfur subunit
MVVNEFQPKILGFLCNWCSYAGADLAGISRVQYPPNLRIIRVMCSGRIDPAFVLEAFKSGADGVLVAGCHLPSDCHYVSGNFKTYRRIAALRKLLEQLGFEPQRLRVEWVSASEGARFADVVKEMTDEIKRLGPNPLMKTGGEIAESSLRELERGDPESFPLHRYNGRSIDE